MRDDRFSFGFKILCTGTPIQNDMKELWTLLHFIDNESFESMDEFLGKYGEMKSKESVDDLHELLRPYILRRLKVRRQDLVADSTAHSHNSNRSIEQEDVEKSMPPKEETIIEVELTVSQKQYYRALYEKNVNFLHKGKSKALDGPSLNNLAMQLRKCCNHVCLLNGIEQELRKQHALINDTDFLVKGSGKLVLLDKLLPRLKEEGHRVLIFSQFKIMLDILEEYVVFLFRVTGLFLLFSSLLSWQTAILTAGGCRSAESMALSPVSSDRLPLTVFSRRTSRHRSL